MQVVLEETSEKNLLKEEKKEVKPSIEPTVMISKTGQIPEVEHNKPASSKKIFLPKKVYKDVKRKKKPEKKAPKKTNEDVAKEPIMGGVQETINNVQEKENEKEKEKELEQNIPKEITPVETMPEETLTTSEEVELIPEPEIQSQELPKEKEEQELTIPTPEEIVPGEETEVQQEIPTQKTKETSGNFLQRASKLFELAKKEIENAWIWNSSEQKNLVKVTTFINDMLLKSPNDLKALDYLNQLEPLVEKVIKAEEELQAYKKKYLHASSWAMRQPEAIALLTNIENTKSAQEEIVNKIVSEIDKSLNQKEKEEWRIILGSEDSKLVDQLEEANNKIAELEAKDISYRNTVGWLNYWVLLQDEGIALTKELNAAKAERKKIADEIIAKIAAKGAQ